MIIIIITTTNHFFENNIAANLLLWMFFVPGAKNTRNAQPIFGEELTKLPCSNLQRAGVATLVLRPIFLHTLHLLPCGWDWDNPA